MNLLQRINLTRNYPESLYHPLPLYQKSQCQSKCHDSFISGFWRDETKVRKVALSPTTFAFREDAVVCCSVTPVSFLPFKERGKKKKKKQKAPRGVCATRRRELSRIGGNSEEVYRNGQASVFVCGQAANRKARGFLLLPSHN